MNNKNLCCSVALCFLFCSCAVGPDYVEPEIATPTAYANQEPSGIAPGDELPKPHDWWTGFGDTTLQALIESATEQNKDIGIALTHVDEARNYAREAKSQLFPGIQFKGVYDSERVSGARFPNSSQGFNFETWTGSVDVGWELDLFGRLRRGLEARTADYDSSIYGVEDAIRIVVADVANTYFQLRSAQAQIEITKENIDVQQKTLKIVQDRRDAGAVSDLDVAQAHAQLSATRALLPPLEASIKSAIYRLSVLCGQNPNEFSDQLKIQAPIPLYHGPIALTEPKELLRRRPDLRAAERSLAAATADVGSNIGDLYPKISFIGSLGVDARSPQELDNGAGTFSIMPQIVWTPLDNGSIHARIGAASARTDRALLTYEQSVLRALEETENALAGFASERARRNELKDSVDASNKAFEIAQLQYSTGSVDLLTVLTANRALLTQQAALVESEANLASSYINIYKALGGGWEDNVVTDTSAMAATPKA